MSNLDSNTRAVCDQVERRISDILEHFTDEPSATWDDFSQGVDVGFLETVKMDLVMLASVVESRIQELGQADQDFGT